MRDTVYAFSHTRPGRVTVVAAAGHYLVDFGGGEVAMRDEYLRSEPETTKSSPTIRVTEAATPVAKPKLVEPTKEKVEQAMRKSWTIKLTKPGRFEMPPGGPADITSGSDLVWVYDREKKKTAKKAKKFADVCRDAVKHPDNAVQLRIAKVGGNNSWAKLDFVLELVK